MLNKGLFTSNKDDWETPQDLFDYWNKIFSFTLDACASHSNAKCPRYWTKETNALVQDWDHETIWCNPPYGRKIGSFVRMACYAKHSSVVMLLPARTDTRWFHDYIYKNPNVQICFLRGRVHFSNSPQPAPFPCMIVIFQNY